MPKPYCTIFAGPNGSGKSSIYEKIQPPGEFVNADEIAKALPIELESNARQVKAGRLAISRINHLIEAKADFAFETTLSSNHSIEVIERAKLAGFHVSILFVALDKPERNIERVRFRVADGGHDIPKDTIIRRYEKSFENLTRVLILVDEAALIDNSRYIPHIVAQIKEGKIVARSYRTTALNGRLMKIAEKASLR